MSYITGPDHARKELARLRDIQNELQNHMIELMEDNSYLSSSMRSCCANRLKYEIRPAIAECLKMIRQYS